MKLKIVKIPKYMLVEITQGLSPQMPNTVCLGAFNELVDAVIFLDKARTGNPTHTFRIVAVLE